MPINNPTRDSVVMGVLQNLIWVGTRVPASQVYIQNRTLLQTSAFPAILITAGEQEYSRTSLHEYIGVLPIKIHYYDKWEQKLGVTIDQVWANIAADLEIVKSTLESNESLVYLGNSYAVSLPRTRLTPYEAQLWDRSFADVPILYRTLTATYNVLPYYA